MVQKLCHLSTLIYQKNLFCSINKLCLQLLIILNQLRGKQIFSRLSQSQSTRVTSTCCSSQTVEDNEIFNWQQILLHLSSKFKFIQIHCFHLEVNIFFKLRKIRIILIVLKQKHIDLWYRNYFWKKKAISFNPSRPWNPPCIVTVRSTCLHSEIKSNLWFRS